MFQYAFILLTQIQTAPKLQVSANALGTVMEIIGFHYTVLQHFFSNNQLFFSFFLLAFWLLHFFLISFSNKATLKEMRATRTLEFFFPQTGGWR